MAGRQHTYRVTVEWDGNRHPSVPNRVGNGRDHTISAGAKPPISGSADPAFRGDPMRWNPEELLLASISACHKLWYLGLCAKAGVGVLSYRDDAKAIMVEDETGAGRFVSATLRPSVTVQAGADLAEASRLHHDAHEYCFIANSVNFPVTCDPTVTAAAPGPALTSLPP